MKQKDRRIKLLSEVLNGIKALKLYAWEDSFNSLITEARKSELQTLRKSSYIQAFMDFTWQSSLFLVS